MRQIDNLDENKGKMEAILDQSSVAQRALKEDVNVWKGKVQILEERNDLLQAELASAKTEVERLNARTSDVQVEATLRGPGRR